MNILQSLLLGAVFGVSFALATQSVYFALRRTAISRDAQRRLAQEIVAEIEERGLAVHRWGKP